MASSKVRRDTNHTRSALPVRQFKRLPLAPRRCAAWVLEVSLIAASALVPLSAGLQAKSYFSSDPVPLNPAVATVEQAIAKTLAIPVSRTHQMVAPITNLLWTGALIAPCVIAGWNFYLLSTTGKTLPKRWLGLRVVTATGDSPGFVRAFMREGVGRWGLPLSVAYAIWRYTGAFPDLSILAGLAGLLLLGENVSAQFDPRRRSLHDKLSGTSVIDASQAIHFYDNRPQSLHVFQNGHVSSIGRTRPLSDEDAAIAAIVLTPEPTWRRGLWYWMRQHPGLTLLIGSLSTMVLVLGTFVGTQIYVQSQANWRELKQQNNQVFLTLVNQLTPASGQTASERENTILALGTIEDPRAVPLLVDLLSQEQNPNTLNAIQQALVSSGPKVLPELQRLNQALRNDLDSLSYSNKRERGLLALRLQATQRAIAKILTVYDGKLGAVDLNRIHLGPIPFSPVQFTLVLDQADLSGMILRGAVLSKANLQGAQFYGPGADQRWGTFDDQIADLSGAELKDANLTGAMLSNVRMQRTSLLRSVLNKANLSDAQLVNANLSSAKLIGANLQQTLLENASFTGADLGSANLSRANLKGARLGQARAADAQFRFANLAQSDWKGADLSRADLSQANLRDANLSSTQLAGTNLSGAQLKNVSFQNADLSRANLRGADLEGADFQGAIFIAAQPTVVSDQFIQLAPLSDQAKLLKGADFTKAKNVSESQLTYICAQGGHHPKCP